jgi:hypothetical protein
MFKDILQRAKDGILQLPLITWVLSGFFLTFLFFFVAPVFFDPSQVMQFNQYLLVLSPIGHDFREIASASSSWLHSGTVPGTLYPALTLIFFAPFTALNFGAGYKILALLILLCYVLLTWVLPKAITKQKSLSALGMLIFVTGLLSYGLQFELERGQWNVLAFTFCLVAVYLFHERPRVRWLAYVLFSISIQLKLFPAIFVFSLVENWSDWKNNLKRFVALGLANILALFIFGFGPMLSTLGSMSDIEASHVGRPFNLSVSSFVLNLLSLSFLPHKRVILWLQANSWLPQSLLFAFFLICFGVILWGAYKRGSKGFDPFVFMGCSIGAFIIPSISFDYKLAAFPAAMMLCLPALLALEQRGNSFKMILLTLLLSVLYSSTLYPYAYKPEWLQYNLPALFLILMIFTILACVGLRDRTEPLSDAPQVDSAAQ